MFRQVTETSYEKVTTQAWADQIDGQAGTAGSSASFDLRMLDAKGRQATQGGVRPQWSGAPTGCLGDVRRELKMLKSPGAMRYTLPRTNMEVEFLCLPMGQDFHFHSC